MGILCPQVTFSASERGDHAGDSHVECTKHRTVTSREMRKLLLKKYKIDSIEDPHSRGLAEFHDLLGRAFGTGEVEPLERFKKELEGNKLPDARAKFLCLVVRDPIQDNRVINGAYASAHKEGVLAVRFTVTETEEMNPAKINYRGQGIGRLADDELIRQAQEYMQAHGGELHSTIAECVGTSEQYWNKFGMKRMYIQTGPQSYQEIYYELPHFGEWNPETGEMVDALPTPQREHLQIATTKPVTPESVREIAEPLWREWYVHDQSEFSGTGPQEAHRKFVMETVFQDRIINPLEGEQLVSLTKAERSAMQAKGMTFSSHIDDEGLEPQTT